MKRIDLRLLLLVLAFMASSTLSAQSPRATGTIVSWGIQVIPYIEPGTRFIAIAAGGHSMALRDDGTVVAWGYNLYGLSSFPAGLSGVVAISAGGGHSVALEDDGSVVAWGRNYYGQARVPAGLTGVVAIAAGGYHNLALKRNGTVVGWGDNYSGQCTAPPDLSGVVAIAAGAYHSLAQKTDGTVVAWGAGTTNTHTGYDLGQAIIPEGLSNVVGISAGVAHSLALRGDGTVVAWGAGTSNAIDSFDVGQAIVPAGLSNVVAIAAGAFHSLALKNDGTVVAWGAGTINGDGLKDHGQATVPAELSNIVAIAAGGYHTLALKNDGTVVAWGDNNSAQSMVPGSLSNVVTVAAGGWASYSGTGELGPPDYLPRSLALKLDGTVAAWGDNNYGLSSFPAGLSGVVAISAGCWHSMALKNDGTVVAWGVGSTNSHSDGNDYGQSIVPPGLTNVMAIAAGRFHSLALQSNGTVVAWGAGTTNSSSNNAFDIQRGQSIVPAGLSGVVAIAAGLTHSLALKNNGTVVAWGYDYQGLTNVPVGLSGVVAIAAGYAHSLALKDDGTVVAWGEKVACLRLVVPADFSDLMAIAAGGDWDLALKSDATVVAWYCEATTLTTGVVAFATSPYHQLGVVRAVVAPVITTQPRSQVTGAGTTATFDVSADGTGQLNFQWRFNGQNIVGATSAPLALNSVGAGNSGGYSVVVRNAYGSAVSDTAYLAVLADGANGNPPPQVLAPPAPNKPSGVDNLVVITHGWEPEGPVADVSWIVGMMTAIQQRVGNDWLVVPFNWVGSKPGEGAWTPVPWDALKHAKVIGTLLGQEIASKSWQHVHLIGHSAGAGLIHAAGDAIRAKAPTTVIQTTFLDPYTGKFLEERDKYGRNADWADDYFVVDFTDYVGVPRLQSPDSTSGVLEWAYNVDVGATLQAAAPVPVYFSSGIAGSTPPVVYTSPSPSHGSPVDFYLSTISGTAPSCAAGYGFPLSMEAGGSGNWAAHLPNNPPLPLCGTLSLSQNQKPVRLDSLSTLSSLPYGTSSSGVSFFGNNGASLSSLSLQLSPQAKSGGIRPNSSGGSSATNGPAWLAVGVTITNAVNFAQFDAGFTDTNTAEGLMTVYWNTNEIGMVDERVAAPGLQTYRFALPSTVTSGLYTLSFRLDAFNNTSSDIAVTNVATGFIGVTQPISLGVSYTNGAPLLRLTGASNFNYLVQSSTNLVDWAPAALLVNTNGMVSFADLTATNSSARFYRALMP